MGVPASSATVEPKAGDHLDPAAAFVPVQTRSERFRSFDPDAFERPTGREVNWKHSPVARLTALFTDEDADSGASCGVEVESDRDLVIESTGYDAPARGEVFAPEDLPSAIAWKRCPNALHHRIPTGTELEQPLWIRLRGTGADRHAHGHLIIEAMPGSKSIVVLEHTGSAQYAQNVEILVRDAASLTVVTLQDWDDDAIHLAAHQARVDRDATLRHIVVSFGGSIVRVNPNVELAGAGARGELYGLGFADAGQHLESQIYLHHKGPHTSGDVLYKNALQGESARTAWVGDVLIGRDAVGTDTYEANRNLILTEGARAESIPNLEIETGDIAGAGHASATGRFDAEQLFYLRSRGIPEDEARRLVVIGFLADIVHRIADPDLEARLLERIEHELTGGAQ